MIMNGSPGLSRERATQSTIRAASDVGGCDAAAFDAAATHANVAAVRISSSPVRIAAAWSGQ
jgi:hypothetical protein